MTTFPGLATYGRTTARHPRRDRGGPKGYTELERAPLNVTATTIGDSGPVDTPRRYASGARSADGTQRVPSRTISGVSPAKTG